MRINLTASIILVSSVLVIGCGGAPTQEEATNHHSTDAGTGNDSQVEQDAAAEGNVGQDAGQDAELGLPPAAPYSVPDTPPVESLRQGNEPGVIFRWRADGTSTSPGTLSDGVGDVTVERPVPFSAFRYGVFDNTPDSSRGFLGENSIATQPQGFTVRAWFRAASVDGTGTLFSNTGGSKGWSLDVEDGHLQIAFSTSDGGTPYRHWVRDEATPIEANRWYYAAVTASYRTDHWRVAFFLDGSLTLEQDIAFDHGSALMNSSERPAVAAEPGGGGLDGEAFNGDIHAVDVHSYPIGDDILGAPTITEGGRYFGAPSYHDYLSVPEPAGSSSASPPYSDRRFNFARRVELTDHDGRFRGLRAARVRLGLPFLNDKFVPSGVTVSPDGRSMWMGFHYVNEEGANPDGHGSFLARFDLPSYRVEGVYRLQDTNGEVWSQAIGGVAQAPLGLYVTTGNRVLRFEPEDAELEADSNPDLPAGPSFFTLAAREAFDVVGPDAAIAYDAARDSLWLSSYAGADSTLERYALTAGGAIAHPSASTSDEQVLLPSSVRFIRGVLPIQAEEDACFLLSSYDVSDQAAAAPTRLYRWCEGRPAAAARIVVSAGAQALTLGPDGTVWSLHQSGARHFQKRKTAPQWYDVLTPYVVGYDVAAFDPKLVGCRTEPMTPYLGDIHTHTSYSDGIELPSDLFEEARNGVGLDFAFVTDHGKSLTAGEFASCRAAAEAATETGGFFASCGFEVSIKSSAGDTLGHSNILFPKDLFPYPATMSALYDRLANCDGCLGQANHPASEKYPWTGTQVSSKADGTLALAELNGGSAVDAIAKYFELLDGGWHVAPAWNSDTHALEPSKGGRRTGVLATSLDEDAIKEGIAARRTFVGNTGNGASLVLDADGCWMGVRLQGYLSATFNVQALDPAVGFDTIELLSRGGELVHSFDCAGETSCQRSAILDIDPSEKYVVAFAKRTDGKWMMSAPVWLED